MRGVLELKEYCFRLELDCCSSQGTESATFKDRDGYTIQGLGDAALDCDSAEFLTGRDGTRFTGVLI